MVDSWIKTVIKSFEVQNSLSLSFTMNPIRIGNTADNESNYSIPVVYIICTAMYYIS